QLGIGAVKSIAECLDILESLDEPGSDRAGMVDRLKRFLGLKSRPVRPRAPGLPEVPKPPSPSPAPSGRSQPSPSDIFLRPPPRVGVPSDPTLTPLRHHDRENCWTFRSFVGR